MDSEIVKKFQAAGVVHIAFSDGHGTSWVNGEVEEVTDSTLLIKTTKGERVAVLIRHVTRLEPYRPRPRGGGV